jgi:hypothetical protein
MTCSFERIHGPCSAAESNVAAFNAMIYYRNKQGITRSLKMPEPKQKYVKRKWCGGLDNGTDLETKQLLNFG